MSDPLSLQVKRVIKASPADLFEAWTQPALMQKWYAPLPAKVTAATSDLRVGGAYRIDVLTGSDPIHVEGVYKQIIPNQLLSYTWTPCTGGPGYETLVTVEFKPANSGTEVIITHEGFKETETRSRHEYGWNGCLDNLAKITETVTA
ncbi:SRPBCC domain-containing protein [Alloacidobacterium dinghuense]|uniref:SRPBCC domain-containing protein n=1 Tax=Alloacidobacterium dinghuense TaxID=2763107 RepID=A0A7G8BIG3_9BACT|nr:SRPBCC domain-containing protein [Alloacidobacterium dinghuense]QNI32333.1 SRPBCC domain-containing protein [Alloacidobacterium dinghuense]